MRVRAPTALIASGVVFGLALGLACGEASASEPRCARTGGAPLPDGLIASPDLARRVALAYLDAVYGTAAIEAEMPLTASLQDGVWTVGGTLPPGRVGGTAVIVLCRRNGAVLALFHGK